MYIIGVCEECESKSCELQLRVASCSCDLRLASCSCDLRLGSCELAFLYAFPVFRRFRVFFLLSWFSSPLELSGGSPKLPGCLETQETSAAGSVTSLSAGSLTALMSLSCPCFFSRLKKYLLHCEFSSLRRVFLLIF